MTTAEEILAHRRSRANERQKAYYAQNRGRILADLRASRVLLREERRAANPPPAPVEYEYEHDHHDAPDDEPPAPAGRAPKAPKRIKYDLDRTIDALRNINVLYPNGKPQAASSITGYVSSTRTIFRQIGVKDDLRDKLMHPERAIGAMRALIGTPKNALSSTCTRITIIMILMDHLPHLNLPDDKKNVIRRLSDAIKLENEIATRLRKQSAEYDLLHFDDYLQKIEAKYGRDSIQNLVARLYKEIPVRDDFKELRVIEKLPEAVDQNMNYLVLPRGNASVVLNAYKTSKKFQHLNLPNYPLSERLTKLLRDYIAAQNLHFGDLLFPKYAKTGLSPLVGLMNKSVGIMKLGVNALRSMSIATLKANNAALSPTDQTAAAIELAGRMRHNPRTAPGYVRNIAPAAVEPQPPKKAGRGRPKKAVAAVEPQPVKKGRGRPKKRKIDGG